MCKHDALLWDVSWDALWCAVVCAWLTWSPRLVFVWGLWDVGMETKSNRSDLEWDVGTGTSSVQQKEVIARACVGCMQHFKNSHRFSRKFQPNKLLLTGLRIVKYDSDSVFIQWNWGGHWFFSQLWLPAIFHRLFWFTRFRVGFINNKNISSLSLFTHYELWQGSKKT